MLAHELPNGRLLNAESIIELRVRPSRLTPRIAEFVDECWEGQGAGERPNLTAARSPR
jgi:hypothetical protein